MLVSDEKTDIILKEINTFIEEENGEKENARAMWRSLSALNVDCKYWVNKANKWVLARSS